MRKRDWERRLFFSKLKSTLKKMDWYKIIDLILKILSLLIIFWK
ncbi:hypothetical protein [Clostridium estertheticum]|nr:hypothetical protein [Clostridium estertheticum]